MTTTKRLLLVSAMWCATTLVPAGAFAQDNTSPQWLGPTRDGHSTGGDIAPRWNAGGPPRQWQTDIGDGYGPPAVQGNTLYVLGKNGADLELKKLRVDTGAVQWTRRVGAAGAGGPRGTAYPGARSTPTIACDGIYVLGNQGDLVKYSDAGNEIWRKSLVTDFGGAVPPWEYSESPLVDDGAGMVIVTPGGLNRTMVGLDPANGNLRWTGRVLNLPAERAAAGYSSAIIATGVRGNRPRRLYVTILGLGDVVAFDMQDSTYYPVGRIETQAAAPTCMTSGFKLFCSAGYGGGAGVRWDLSNLIGGVTEEWRNNRLNSTTATSVVVNDLIFGTSASTGIIRLVDWNSGANVADGGRRLGNGSAGMTHLNGKLILVYDNGVVSMVSAARPNPGQTGAPELANFTLPGGPHRGGYATPVVVGTRLLVRFKGTLFSFDLSRAGNNKPVAPAGAGADVPPPAGSVNIDFTRISTIGSNTPVGIDTTVLGDTLRSTSARMIEVTATAMEWEAVFPQRILLIFGPAMRLRLTHNGAGIARLTVRYGATAATLNDTYELVGRIRLVEGSDPPVLRADWFNTRDPDLIGGEPYMRTRIQILPICARGMSVESVDADWRPVAGGFSFLMMQP